MRKCFFGGQPEWFIDFVRVMCDVIVFELAEEAEQGKRAVVALVIPDFFEKRNIRSELFAHFSKCCDFNIFAHFTCTARKTDRKRCSHIFAASDHQPFLIFRSETSDDDAMNAAIMHGAVVECGFHERNCSNLKELLLNMTKIG